MNQKPNSDKEKILEGLREIPVVSLVLKRSGVSKTTFYNWKKESKEFSNNVDHAMRESVMSVNDLAEGQLIKKIRDGNMTAIRYWLDSHSRTYNARITLADQIDASPEFTPRVKKRIKQILGLIKQENEI